MIKHHQEDRVENVMVVDDVLCNKCGKSIFLGSYQMRDDEGELPNYRQPHISGIEIRNRWGYHSKKDQVETAFHLCEDCHDEIMASLKIPAVVIDWMNLGLEDRDRFHPLTEEPSE